MKYKIIVENVNKNYGNLCVLKDISLNVNESEFVSVIGPSGCGKTTLLYLIQGFAEKSAGTIKVNGKKGFVFQDHNLFPWKTVKENIEIAPLNQGLNKSEAEKISKGLLKEVGLENFGNHYPYQ